MSSRIFLSVVLSSVGNGVADSLQGLVFMSFRGSYLVKCDR